MKRLTKKNTLTLLLIIIVLFFMFVSVQITTHQKNKVKKNSTMFIGLKSSQQEYFAKQLSGFSRELNQIHLGDALVKQGRLDEAIQHFNNLINDQSFEDKYMARTHLIDAYEKKRDYATAYQALYKQQRNPKFVLPVTDPVRVPAEERLKYLKYASEGNYNLAIKHAQFAIEAEKQIPNCPKEMIKITEQRLNDLKASKAYIESLKKQPTHTIPQNR